MSRYVSWLDDFSYSCYIFPSRLWRFFVIYSLIYSQVIREFSGGLMTRGIELRSDGWCTDGCWWPLSERNDGEIIIKKTLLKTNYSIVPYVFFLFFLLFERFFSPQPYRFIKKWVVPKVINWKARGGGNDGLVAKKEEKKLSSLLFGLFITVVAAAAAAADGVFASPM